jgi:hypothetical protein
LSPVTCTWGSRGSQDRRITAGRYADGPADGGRRWELAARPPPAREHRLDLEVDSVEATHDRPPEIWRRRRHRGAGATPARPARVDRVWAARAVDHRTISRTAITPRSCAGAPTSVDHECSSAAVGSVHVGGCGNGRRPRRLQDNGTVNVSGERLPFGSIAHSSIFGALFYRVEPHASPDLTADHIANDFRM